MSTDKQKTEISTHVERPEVKDLALVRGRGLITEHQEQQILAATNDAQSLIHSAAFRQQADPLERHASFADGLMFLAPGGASAITRAREALANVHQVWESVRPEFHKYKRMFYQKAKKEAEAINLAEFLQEESDDRKKRLMQADLNLLRAEIEELEAELNYGERHIRQAMEEASEASGHYALILKETGKTSLTKEDFEAEELEYFLMAAFWHASNTFKTFVHSSSAKHRITGRVQRAIQEGADPNNMHLTDFADPHQDIKIQLDEDAFMFLQALGIHRTVIEVELKNLLAQKQAFDQHHESSPQDFSERHRNWLTTMSRKYLETAQSKVVSVGYARVRRMGTALTQTFEKSGWGRQQQMNWDGVTR